MPDSPVASRPPGPPADGDGATAPKETGPRPGTPSCSPPSHPPAMEDDFQFVLCEGCRQESPNLKLLTCLHTLCLDCLSENKPIRQCPVCRTAIPQASGIPDMDNLLFTNLQAKLSIYKKIRDSDGPSCSRCRGESATVWCSECEEFLCAKCFEDHQWFFKKRSHEARKVEDLRAESAHQFLEDTRKSCNLFCSRPGHADQGHISSIYCKRCEKALCCSCALLDSQHAPFCDIRSETQRRQEELGTMNQELKQKRSGFEATYAALQDEAARLEEAQREMRELIGQRVEQLVRLIRQEEEELLGLVEAWQEQGRRELARELQHVEGVLRRMEAGEQLVEKMRLYATEQEVMDMQPFIKDSLDELQRLQPPAAGDRAQSGDLAKCRARLQALVERVMGHPGTNSQADPMVEVAPEKNLQGESVQPKSQTILPTFTINLEEMQMSPALSVSTWPKRRSCCVETGSQISPKVLKLEYDNMPVPINPSSNQWDGRMGPRTSTPSQNCSSIPATSSHIDDAEDTSIIISSSEDSSEDTVASSKPKDSKKPSSPTWSGSGTSPHHSTGPTSPLDDGLELSTLVFLSLKVDQKTQLITEVAAVNGEHTFKTLIQTPESVLALLSQGVPMEVGMQHLLWYLSPLPRPILIVYNFWALELPALFKALDATGRKVDFCRVVGGYVDMLSLIKEKLPKAPSYKLKNLLRRHLQQQLNEGSALATAKALQELWGALELPAHADTGMMLTHCNLQSYTILQPLVQEKLLTKRAAKTLARRSLILWELEEA
ncbi:protein PML [Aquila chrysaetos chrysaetos]|uniref:protein PML n=1 Tax=Aquila chrysaetos chrysaetos TaxID=223781 RepID=UPI0011772177|nr:protein PML [Aquila chrysaetos chrysaetos]XP_029869228.1 protein PML [Aquila chrysaetos chrysaetos]XP_040979548.1 protein PML [Aquila chrysaetos chrysaetos]XP_040979549.1 protein PML [Aquila chrysaetos chrysaetos]